MRSTLYLFIVLLPCLAFIQVEEQRSGDHFESVSTGIILDSMNNEVLLVLKNGQPFEYVSHIFTPVCNTGECLPVYITIYWDLSGKYRSFDFNEGEILTKLDHVPFTPEDYTLLDEILHGNDPRFTHAPKHSEPAHQSLSQGDVSPSNPAPSAPTKVFQTKYEMVDGITGSTLPEQSAKFVPGALYTTYTLWGLANDHRQKMADYTVAQLLPTHRNYLLEWADLNCQDFVLDELAKQKHGADPRITVMMEIFDETDGPVNIMILDRIYYFQVNMDFVASSLERKFFAPKPENDPNNTVKKRILSLWTSSPVSDETLLHLATTPSASDDLFPSILTVLENHPIWPDGTVQGLMNQVALHNDANVRRSIFDLVSANKKNLSQRDWALVQREKKRVGFQ